MKEQKKNKLRKSKSVINKYISNTNVDNHIFIGTEGEDILEANLSFLIELLGSKLYETYVDEILNMSSKKNIKVVAVAHPSTPPKDALIKGQPCLFYGNNGGTHYTCSVDGEQLWNSYKHGIQANHTDHFCQTFALMRTQHEFLPNSQIGKTYLKLKRGEYMDNAFIAKNVACDILKLLNNDFNINKIVENLLKITDRTGKLRHQRNNPNIKFNVEKFIDYCRGLTKTQLSCSSFYDRVYLK